MKKCILSITAFILSSVICLTFSSCRRSIVSEFANPELEGITLEEYIDSDKSKITDKIKISFDISQVDEKFNQIKSVNIYSASEHYFENDEEIQKVLTGGIMEKVDRYSAYGNEYINDDGRFLSVYKRDSKFGNPGLLYAEHSDNLSEYIDISDGGALDGVFIDAGINPQQLYQKNKDIEHLGSYTEYVEYIEDILKKIGIEKMQIKNCFAVENSVTEYCLEKMIEWSEKKFGESDFQMKEQLSNLDESDEAYVLTFKETVDSIDITSTGGIYDETAGASTSAKARIENDSFELTIGCYWDVGKKLETVNIINAADAMDRVLSYYGRGAAASVEILSQTLNYHPFEKDGEYILKPLWIFYVKEQSGENTEYGQIAIDAQTGNYLLSDLKRM